jgi:hypothetical protein
MERGVVGDGWRRDGIGMLLCDIDGMCEGAECLGLRAGDGRWEEEERPRQVLLD